MKISVFGLGYVGTVCSACLAERGHIVIGVDRNEMKVNLIRSGSSPIVERDIHELIKHNVEASRLTATEDAREAVSETDLSIVCVGTPSRPNGAISIDSIDAVSTEIGHAIRTKKNHTIVIRSTVMPGTIRSIVAPRIAESSGKLSGIGFGLAFNPEFLREGSAVADFNSPSKTVVGSVDEATAATVMSLYADLPGPKITTSPEIAELVKYVDNSWHALKVAFGNEIGLIAKSLGIDSYEVMNLFFQDKRQNISEAYMLPGFAFGGSCLPKDLRAITYLGKSLDLSLPVLGSIIDSNRQIVERGVQWILDHARKRIAFLGISFKAGTDDVRESPFVEMIERLIGKGCQIRIFDPDVRLSQLMGANKEYLMRHLPHIAELIVPEASNAMDWAELIVVTAANSAYAAALMTAQPDQIVLDFARVTRQSERPAQAKGFLW
jgi:GDP-mannose 6-dehydrogenase